MKKLILSILLLSTSHTSADSVEVILSQTDQYLGTRAFEETFITGDVIHIRLDENAAGVKSEVNTLSHIENAAAFIRVTHKDKKDGTETGKETFTRHQWENNWKANCVRILIEKIQADGYKLDMEIADYPVFRLIFRGRPAAVNTMKLSYTGTNSRGEKITGDIYVTSQLPGLGQVIGHRQKQLGLERYWSVISFSRVTPFPNQ